MQARCLIEVVAPLHLDPRYNLRQIGKRCTPSVLIDRHSCRLAIGAWCHKGEIKLLVIAGRVKDTAWSGLHSPKINHMVPAGTGRLLWDAINQEARDAVS